MPRADCLPQALAEAIRARARTRRPWAVDTFFWHGGVISPEDVQVVLGMIAVSVCACPVGFDLDIAIALAGERRAAAIALIVGTGSSARAQRAAKPAQRRLWLHHR